MYYNGLFQFVQVTATFYPLECSGYCFNLYCYIHNVSTNMFLGKKRGCPRGVMVKAMDCGIIVLEFVLQSRYYVHFRANTLGKGMNPLILPAMGEIVPLLFF